MWTYFPLYNPVPPDFPVIHLLSSGFVSLGGSLSGLVFMNKVGTGKVDFICTLDILSTLFSAPISFPHISIVCQLKVLTKKCLVPLNSGFLWGSIDNSFASHQHLFAQGFKFFPSLLSGWLISWLMFCSLI